MLLLRTDTEASTEFNTRSYDLYNSDLTVYGRLIETIVDLKDNKLAAPPLFYLLTTITWEWQLHVSLVQLLRSQRSQTEWCGHSKKKLNLQNNKYLVTVKLKFMTYNNNKKSKQNSNHYFSTSNEHL
jgi:hypothetical protein